MASKTESKPETTGSGRRRRSETATYLVQIRKSVPGAEAWTDLDILTVPSGTKRATLLEKIRTEVPLGLEPGERAMLRVFPGSIVGDFTGVPVEMEQPPPRLKLS